MSHRTVRIGFSGRFEMRARLLVHHVVQQPEPELEMVLSLLGTGCREIDLAVLMVLVLRNGRVGRKQYAKY
ncbi:MAG: hypothetical protein ACOCTG_04405 [Bacteroidota bacterium]